MLVELIFESLISTPLFYLQNSCGDGESHDALPTTLSGAAWKDLIIWVEEYI